MIENRLKEIRMKEYMMNLTEFARLLGYDLRTVSSWEKGNSKPDLERAIDISNKLNRTVNDIWSLTT